MFFLVSYFDEACELFCSTKKNAGFTTWKEPYFPALGKIWDNKYSTE